MQNKTYIITYTTMDAADWRMITLSLIRLQAEAFKAYDEVVWMQQCRLDWDKQLNNLHS